ncbi:hypothetical protein BDZ94DRAFT_1347703 [Collybia nuda]|uniref:Uncharacterized protein n=1 Tax=Collybia nuda TaxID=64659 RepID=A0A9P6CCY2_9AGAR|nr:hypothetical protein BDZ94DRAFT_1347703 [Collybia nuda]
MDCITLCWSGAVRKGLVWVMEATGRGRGSVHVGVGVGMSMVVWSGYGCGVVMGVEWLWVWSGYGCGVEVWALGEGRGSVRRDTGMGLCCGVVGADVQGRAWMYEGGHGHVDVGTKGLVVTGSDRGKWLECGRVCVGVDMGGWAWMQVWASGGRVHMEGTCVVGMGM